MNSKPNENSGKDIDHKSIAKSLKVVDLDEFKNSHLLAAVLYHVMKSVGLSCVFSSFLVAAQRSLKDEENIEIKDAMTEFIEIGSSLNERYVLKTSEDRLC